MTKAELQEIINDNTTKKGRLFDHVIELLIFASLIGYALETLPNNPPAMQSTLKWVERIAVFLFTIEYLRFSFS